MERFVAFDVETPNYENNRMSAIGIATVKGEEITGTFGTVINPETYFASFHVALTGITPGQAERAPAFWALWPTVEPLLSGGILLAHNAPFDLGVLARCLRAYSIDWAHYVPYICTVRMSRAALPQLPNHRLNTLCEHWDIPLEHHRAESDSLACAQLFLNCRRAGVAAGRFLRWYDLLEMRTLTAGEALALRKSGRPELSGIDP